MVVTCSYHSDDTCRDCSVATSQLMLEILNFRHFHKHIVFVSDGSKIRNKELKMHFNVSVVIYMEYGNTK
ncbi:hypothetical protein EXM56_11965 [Clostridium botulinum]|uniref:Uncharacterized protein n=1 Tax=Clostridium botulinum TaxID=1491 RepID=A0A6G4CRG7_CLOBO|nr:hypothetical protein [Clostridium botulinum]NEZ98374.1 hypothetical protein [Clostridium botulinum]NFA30067.1 hypothetical protein [Clostridium botulinum]NFA86433.1 hypothetical protein [Clostridium botulinum]NFB05106.1 hypothetical protein [Clostridium botulinum]